MSHPSELTSGQEAGQNPLKVLVGEWQIIGTHPMLPGGVRGRATCVWLQEGALLTMRTEMEQPGPPNSVAVIGRDDTDGSYAMLYYDDRNVSRIYRMSLGGRAWKMWRDAPGFFQRLTGTISPDGTTIQALWERSSDGAQWEEDLAVTYSKR